MSSEEAGAQPPADGHHPAFFPASNLELNGQGPPDEVAPNAGSSPPEAFSSVAGQIDHEPMDRDLAQAQVSSSEVSLQHSTDTLPQALDGFKVDDAGDNPEQQHTEDFAALDLDSMSAEERASYLAMITEAATSAVPSAVGSPQQMEMPDFDMDQIQQAVSDAVATAGLELQSHIQSSADDDHAQQESGIDDGGQVQHEQSHDDQDASMDQGAPQDASSPPAFDMSHFGESSLEAIAAAQIAAGLGDFNFSGDDQAEVEEAPNGDAIPEQAHNDTDGATTVVDQTAPAADQPLASQPDTSDGPRGIKRGREDEDTEPQSANDLLDQFTTTSATEGDDDNGDYEPITQSSIDAMTAAATAAVAGEQAQSPPQQPTQTFQKAFSQFTFKPTTTEAAFQRYAPARPDQASTATPARPARPLPMPRPPIGPSSVRPTPPPRPAPGPHGRPSGAPTGTMPRPPTSFPRPPPPPAPSTDGATHRPMPRPMPRPGARPAPPRPGARPAGAPARPAAPALPASALFSGGAASGAPSFAALLSTLGPKDLAMVAHAAMGLDAEGNPLPGNEESHRALADAMKRLRESTMQPPPPPPSAGTAGSTAQGTQQKGTSSAQPKAKSAKKEGDKSGEGAKSGTAKKTQTSSGKASSPNRSLPPDTVQRVLDALPRNTGDPLQDKQPLIAGPKPDRAPPKPGPPPEKRFQCPKCDRAFARAYNLNTHLSTHDPDPHRSKPFPCPYPSCRTEKRSFSRKHDLQRHIASTHESEPEPEVEVGEDGDGEPATATLAQLGLGAPGRKFRCECGRAFVRRDALRRHNCEAMKAKWPEYANQDNSASARRGGKGEQLSVLEQASDADFDAIAASFAAAAEEEMRAAQEHAARAAANRDSAEGSDGEQDGAKDGAAEQTKQDKAPADEAQDDGDDGETETHTDDALAKLASQLTADAALGMGLDMSLGGAEEAAAPEQGQELSKEQGQEQGPERPQGQQDEQPEQPNETPQETQQQDKEQEKEQPKQQPPEQPPQPQAQVASQQEEPKEQQADAAATSGNQEPPTEPVQSAAETAAGTNAEATAASASEPPTTAPEEKEEAKPPGTDAASQHAPTDPSDAAPSAEDAPMENAESQAQPEEDTAQDDYSEQQVNDAASQFMAQLQGQLGQSGDDEEDGSGGSNLMGDLLASMTGGGGENQDVEMGEAEADSKPEHEHEHSELDTANTKDQPQQHPPSPHLIPKQEEDEERDRDGALHLTPDTSITA